VRVDQTARTIAPPGWTFSLVFVSKSATSSVAIETEWVSCATRASE